MQILSTIKLSFQQLIDSIEQLTEVQYVTPSDLLFQATIGQHVRHIIELFLCLNKGYTTGIVNYEKRDRDLRIETDKAFACDLLFEIAHNLDQPDRSLLLEANHHETLLEEMIIATTYYREVLYNLEHTIHHMALIRVGIKELTNIQLPSGYGVAASTIKYKKACAQ
jgi:hypothetical protein